ncbi:MAG TPA: efflux RND transporter permease subunit [Gaiellaceae bacterium]|nr:efflux RND transporter permease subunit [Gaiellaceae bacterium]
MRWIVARSLRFRWLALFGAAAVLFFGFLQARDAPLDVFPEFAPPIVEVQTIALGNTSTEVEELITIPIEDALNGIEGLDKMRSYSVEQLSSIKLYFKRGTDLYRSRQLVQERLAGVTSQLPTWASPPFMMPPLSSTARVMKIGMTSSDLSMEEMSAIAYWRIRQRLLRVPGVANVLIYGERLQQRHVQVDPQLLAKFDVSLTDVMETTANALDAGVLQFAQAFTVGTGGFVESGDVRMNVRNVQPIVTEEDLAKVAVERANGEVIRLSDLGNVVEDHIPLWGDALIDERPGLMLIVQKLPRANTLEVTHGVEDAMDEMGPGLPGITIQTDLFRPATFIERAIHNLFMALVLGVMLVVLILAAFLLEWRTAFISLLAIPLSLVGAVLILELFDVVINVMILAGLVVAIGVVVDDAIIDVENIVRRLRQARAEGRKTSTFQVVLEASVEVRSAIIYATLIDVVAILPVFFLGGLSGSFFKPLVLAYGLAVMVSLIIATTVTPALCFLLLSKGHTQRESPLTRALRRAYGTILARVIARPQPAIVTAALTIGMGLVIFPTLGQSLLPSFKENDLITYWATKPGTSLPETMRIAARGCGDYQEAVPAVEHCSSHAGQALLGDEIHGVNFDEQWVHLDPDADYDQAVAGLREVIDSYPGLYRTVQTYLRERVKEVLSGANEAIVVRVFGPDINVLSKKAEEIAAKMGGIDGIIDERVEQIEQIPQIEVEVDVEAARRYGITPGHVRRQSSVLLASEEVGDIFSGGKAYDVHVWSIPSAHDSVTDVENLPIDTPSGAQVPLHRVADIRIRPIANTIKHEEQSRRVDAVADVSGRDLASTVDDVKAQLDEVDFPPGYHAEVLGEAPELNAAQNHLLVYGLIAMAVIFFLVQAGLGSTRLAVLVMLLLPMAIAGAVLAAKATTGILELGSLVGFLTVLGIAGRNGILMISHFQHLERVEGEPFGPALVLRGAQERLAPILMTASATGFALVPLVVAGTVPGNEIEHPLAVTILGGLVTATLLNLFVLPSLYLAFAKPRKKGRSNRP